MILDSVNEGGEQLSCSARISEESFDIDRLQPCIVAFKKRRLVQGWSYVCRCGCSISIKCTLWAKCLNKREINRFTDASRSTLLLLSYSNSWNDSYTDRSDRQLRTEYLVLRCRLIFDCPAEKRYVQRWHALPASDICIVETTSCILFEVHCYEHCSMSIIKYTLGQYVRKSRIMIQRTARAFDVVEVSFIRWWEGSTEVEIGVGLFCKRCCLKYAAANPLFAEWCHWTISALPTR